MESDRWFEQRYPWSWFPWLCWAIPAIGGVGATVLFFLTHAEVFVVLGLVMVPFGCILFVVGLFCLQFTKSPVLAAVLLFSNFPLAYLCARVGFAIAVVGGGATVEVVNNTSASLDGTYVQFVGKRWEVARIPKNASRRIAIPYVNERSDMIVVVRSPLGEFSHNLGNFDGDDYSGQRAVVSVTERDATLRLTSRGFFGDD